MKRGTRLSSAIDARSSARQVSAIDDQLRTRHEAGFVTRQEQYPVGEFDGVDVVLELEACDVADQADVRGAGG